MTHGTFPRQPREGNPDNAARVVEHSGQAYFGVECRQADGSWFEVAQFAGGSRARAMRDELELISARAAAALEFTHMPRRSTGAYVVMWPTVRWDEDDALTTTVGGCPSG